MAFANGYNRDGVAGGIERACERHNVNGLIVYELFGSYDVLVRAWLPDGVRCDELDSAFKDELGLVSLDMCEFFEVDYMVRHWPFMNPDGSAGDPEKRWITRLTNEEISEVEGNWPDVRTDLLERLTNERLLAPMGAAANERPGIKFAIEIDTDGPSDVRTLAELEQELVGIIERASEIGQRSLYSGAGFARFLIMGRVDYERFHAIHSDLISQINAAGLSETFNTNTLTHISGQRGYRIAREGLAGERRKTTVGPFLRERAFANMDPDRQLEPGEEFGGRFRIVEYLGQGGFASVYSAEDTFERGVMRALKIFRSANREAAYREISALRRVNHPNVVKPVWWDHDGPLWYLITEYVEGASLDEIPGKGDLWALSVMVETLRGLEAVHPDEVRIAALRAKGAKEDLSSTELAELQALKDNGLVHRDIKPGNLMVGLDDHVTIVDFNIASPAYEQGKTRSGTQEYMAPDAGYDGWEPADDLFSCGVVLYELLVREHPFPERMPKAGVDPLDPRTQRPDLPEPLIQVLLRSCAPLRSERYQNAEEMRVALEQVYAEAERLEESVRLAVWQWQQTRSEAPTASRRPDTQQAIELSQAMLDHFREFPSDDSPPQSPSRTGNGDRPGGGSDGDGDEEPDDGDGDEEPDDGDGDEAKDLRPTDSGG